MISQARKNLSSVGGLHMFVGVLAIGWGLNLLSRVAEARAERLTELDEAISAREAQLAELAPAELAPGDLADAEPAPVEDPAMWPR